MGLTFATKPRHAVLRPRTLVVGLVVVVLAVGGFFLLHRGHSSPPSLPTTEVDGFLSAWTSGNVGGMAAFIETPPPDLATPALSLVKSAPGSTVRYTPTSLVRTKTGATATYRADVTTRRLRVVRLDRHARLRAGEAAQAERLAHPLAARRSLSRARRRSTPRLSTIAMADASADRRGRRFTPRRCAVGRADRARARSHHQEPAHDQEDA